MNGVIKGERVRELRQEKRWTLQRLADESGVDLRTISDIELGRNLKPSFDKVVCLARALEVAPEVLWPVGVCIDPQSPSAVDVDPVTTRDLSEVP